VHGQVTATFCSPIQAEAHADDGLVDGGIAVVAADVADDEDLAIGQVDGLRVVG
jgi:hypothetical protein